jgi:hypothetical protein
MQTTLGVIWLAFLASAGIALAFKDARVDTTLVSGPGGSIRVARADAGTYQGALSTVARLTRPGEPVLFAPQLSALYVLSDRPDPLAEISLLPGAYRSAPGEQQAITRLNAAHVQVIVTDTHRFTEYGHGSFGISFDRLLATWVKRHFSRVATFGGQAHTLIVWRRGPS